MNKLTALGASVWVILSLGCASSPSQDSNNPPLEASEPKGPSSADSADPWEGLNRATFAFNERLDAWLLRPSARAYRFITPDLVETGVSNFFGNLEEVPDTVNYLLQWKPKKAAHDGGRFLINSTLGVAGIFDVAARAGLPKADPESFGQTFSYWGIPAGPYLVIPFLGPSTVTDAVGLPLNWEVHPTAAIEDQSVRWSVAALSLLEKRTALLDAESMITGDKYTFIRGTYLQRREYLVRDGEQDLDALEALEADFGGFEGFEDFDEDF